MSLQLKTLEESRPLANFSPSVWGYHFLSSAPIHKNDEVQIPKRLQLLKEEVKHLLLGAKDPIEKLNLIDTIQRLGVSYHFESEIEAILEDTHRNNTPFNNSNGEDDALYSLALRFRLLRQKGYKVSSRVFESFKDDKGEFKMSLIGNVLGMLSLYEAAHLAIHGEDILDQALHFTTLHLQSGLSEMKSEHREKVVHALKWPLHKSMPRLTARHNIAIYSREDSRNKLWLEFAMLDFNALQRQQQEELRHHTEWFKKLELVKVLPYARVRIVEAYFFNLCAHFEPQYGIGRTTGSKYVSLIAFLDDTYDAYATIEELECITEAFQRWDTSPMDSLPESMKRVVEVFIELLTEMKSKTAGDRKSHLIQYVKRAVQSLTQSYMIEANWRNEGYVPTYDEYKENGIITSIYPGAMAISLLFLGKYATEEVFDWLANIPKMVKASTIIARITNDLTSYKFEHKRGTVVSAIECCMKQYDIYEEEAIKILHNEIENLWKDINEELFLPNVVPKPVLEIVLNYTRVLTVIYANMEDGYTHGELLKDSVTLLLVDPIHIDIENQK